VFMFYGLHRKRSGFVASTPDGFGGFVLTAQPRVAVKFWTRSAAERFKTEHRKVLGGGWSVVHASRTHAFWLGLTEGFGGLATGITYEDDAESPRSRAYDRGRNLGEFFARFRRA